MSKVLLGYMPWEGIKSIQHQFYCCVVWAAAHSTVRLGVAWRWDVQLSCDTTGSPSKPVDRKHVGFFARGEYCVSKSIFVLCESLLCSSRCPVVVTPHTISQVIDVSKSLSGCRSKEVLLSFVIARRKVCGSVKTLVCERYATSGDRLLLRRDCSIHPVSGYLW